MGACFLLPMEFFPAGLVTDLVWSGLDNAAGHHSSSPIT